jgi:hypothetical protein
VADETKSGIGNGHAEPSRQMVVLASDAHLLAQLRVRAAYPSGAST